MRSTTTRSASRLTLIAPTRGAIASNSAATVVADCSACSGGMPMSTNAAYSWEIHVALAGP